MPEYLLAFEEKQVIGRFNAPYLTVGNIDKRDRLLCIVRSGTEPHRRHFNQEAIQILTTKYDLL
jgi:hypothetical protein